MASVDVSHITPLAPVGTTFLDEDGDLCIYLGPGGWRNSEIVGSVNVAGSYHSIVEMNMMPACHVVAYNYKGEWHLGEMENYQQAALLKQILTK